MPTGLPAGGFQPMAFRFTDFLLGLIIFQLLFVSFFLMTHTRGKPVSNRLLGGFFLAFALNLIDTLLLLQGVYFAHPDWGLWGTNLALLYGPLLYLHTQSVIRRDFRLRPAHGLHALPFVLLTLVSLAGYHSLSPAEQRVVLQQILRQSLPSWFYLISALILLNFLVYLLLALRLIRQYRRALSQQFSAMHDKNLRWLSSTLLFFLVFPLVALLRSLLTNTPFASYRIPILLALLLGLFWYINRFLLQALRQPERFLGMPDDSLDPDPEAPAHPSAAPAEHEAILGQLQTFMDQHKPYREPELSLDELASRLGLRPRQLSQALNDGLGQHFFDYINRLRIEEAKERLSNPADPKITVLEVMYQVGFNSKSSFNTLFRKYTGQTPSEWKKAQKP